MKKGILYILINFIFAIPVTENIAEEIAENFYYYKNDSRISTFSVESIETFNNNIILRARFKKS